MGKRIRGLGMKIAYLSGNISIQFKLIAAYILIILIPIILFSRYMFEGVYERTIQDTVRKNQYLLESEKSAIQNNMEMMGRTAQLTISDKEVTAYLQSASEPDTNDLIAFNMNTFNNLQRLLFHNPNIANIRLFTNNVHAKEIWPIIFNEKRISGKAWYKEVLGKNGVVWWVIDKGNPDIVNRYISTREEEQTYVSLLREIKYNNDPHVGILQVDMKIEDFFSKTFNGGLDAQSQMLVTDRSNHVYTNEQTEFMKNIDVRLLQREFVANRARGNTSFQIKIGGIPYLCLYNHIDVLDADILNVISLKQPLTEIHRARNTIIVTTIVLIALLSLITYFLQSLILKKLNILRDSMKRVRKGDFQFDIDIRGSGEVGELAHHFRQMLKKINGLIADAVNKQAATKEAELNSLKNQIDAHFLYNTLENLKMLAEMEAQYTISDALTSLGGMMRYSLDWTSNHVRLSDEIQHIQNYEAIMNIRYDGKLQLSCDIPSEYMGQELLKMSLQPVVENAVKHGMNAEAVRNRGIAITIRAYEQNGAMLLEISDNGVGMTEDRLREVQEKIHRIDLAYHGGHGIGLRNVNQRIVMHYGADCGLQVESIEGAYTRVVMKLPYLILSGGMADDANASDR